MFAHAFLISDFNHVSFLVSLTNSYSIEYVTDYASFPNICVVMYCRLDCIFSIDLNAIAGCRCRAWVPTRRHHRTMHRTDCMLCSRYTILTSIAKLNLNYNFPLVLTFSFYFDGLVFVKQQFNNNILGRATPRVFWIMCSRSQRLSLVTVVGETGYVVIFYMACVCLRWHYPGSRASGLSLPCLANARLLRRVTGNGAYPSLRI